jgi:hypothetical protein
VGGPAVAADGQRIAFTVSDNGKTLLYVVGENGGRAVIAAAGLDLRGNPVWMRDGQALVSAVLYSGEPRLTRLSLNGDPPLPFVPEYSIDPVWSPDGRFLLFFGPDIGTSFPLRAAAADGRPYAIASLMLARGSRIAFSGDPQTLVILRAEPGHMIFSAVNLRTGTQRVLAELPPNFVARDFDISPTGTEIIFDRVEDNPDVALIERGP